MLVISQTEDLNRTITDLYGRFSKKVNNLAYRMTGSRMTADDITHETFIRVFEKYHSFKGKSDISTWIYSIAKNTCFQHFRKSKRSDFKAMGSLIETAGAENDGRDFPTEESKQYTEQIKEGCLLGLLRCLPFSQRTAFFLYVLHDFKIEDVSRIVGKSPNAARILVHRARESLKRFLCNNCSLYDPGNSCRCENLISFSLKRGWISPAAANAARIESELHEFRDEVALYRSLPEKDIDDTILQRISEYIERAQSAIFQKK